MDTVRGHPQQLRRTHRTGGRAGLRIASIRGIEIRLDVSLAIIFTLVVYSLASGVFPAWHKDWGAGLIWLTALAAGLLFFISLLAHELAHSLVAQLRGIRVPRITLFVFGGVSELEREPDSPGTEFLIAIVGPATSIGLGLFFSTLCVALAEPSFPDQFAKQPEAALATLGPVATLMAWLGPINLVLGLFNLVPGFPLDGGRVLRAVLWWFTGSLEIATEWASRAGRGFAWGLMGLGVFQAFAGGFLQGLWLVLIGWFLHNAARSSQVQVQLRQALEQLRVGDLMRTRFESVQPGVPLSRFVDECLLRSDQNAWPVVEGHRLVGLVTFDDVRAIDEARRNRLTVADVMGSVDEYLGPETGGRDALTVLLQSRRDPVPVLHNGQVIGLLHRADIMRWLALHQLNVSSA